MGFVWFWLVAIMIVAYVVLDGFDLGVGILHPFLARTDEDKQLMLRSIGPVWDGNEVWLLAGGGTLYFAFPLLYASAFSGFYLALMIVLWLLIMRGLGVELRMHMEIGVWRSFFDELLSNGRAPAQDQPGLSPVQSAPSGGAETAPIRVSPGPLHATYDWGREGDTETGRRGDGATRKPVTEPVRESAAPALQPEGQVPALVAESRAADGRRAGRPG